MIESCGNCRFWRRVQPMQPMGHCRFNPPTPLVVGMQQNKITQQVQPIVDSFWPMLPDTEWCGGWGLRLGAVDMKELDARQFEDADTEGSA